MQMYRYTRNSGKDNYQSVSVMRLLAHGIFLSFCRIGLVNLPDNPTTHTTNGGIVFAIIPHDGR